MKRILALVLLLGATSAYAQQSLGVTRAMVTNIVQSLGGGGVSASVVNAIVNTNATVVALTNWAAAMPAADNLNTVSNTANAALPAASFAATLGANSYFMTVSNNLAAILKPYGPNVYWAIATPNSLTNGLNLLAQMESLKSLTPNGHPRNETNRIAIVVHPGDFNCDTNSTMWDALGGAPFAKSVGLQLYDFIDIIGACQWAPQFVSERERAYALNPALNELSSYAPLDYLATTAPIRIYKTANSDYVPGVGTNANTGPVMYAPNVSRIRLRNLAVETYENNLAGKSGSWFLNWSVPATPAWGVTNVCALCISNNTANFGGITTNEDWQVQDCLFYDFNPLWKTSEEIIAMTPIWWEFNGTSGGRATDIRGTWKNVACNGHGWRLFANACIFGTFIDCFGGIRGFGGDAVASDNTKLWCFNKGYHENCVAGYGSFSGCSSVSHPILDGAVFRRCFAGACSFAIGTLFDGYAQDCVALQNSFAGCSTCAVNGMIGTNAVIDNCRIGVVNDTGVLSTNSMASFSLPPVTGYWDTNHTYAINDVVWWDQVSNGGGYVTSLQNSNKGRLPTSGGTAYWGVPSLMPGFYLNFKATGTGYSLQANRGGCYGTVRNCVFTNVGTMLIGPTAHIHNNTITRLDNNTNAWFRLITDSYKLAGPVNTNMYKASVIGNRLLTAIGAQSIVATTNVFDTLQFDFLYYTGAGSSSQTASTAAAVGDPKMMFYFQTPTIPGSVSVYYVNGGTNYTVTDNGAGAWNNDASGATTGTINYTTGAYSIGLHLAPTTATSVMTTYLTGASVVAAGNICSATNLTSGSTYVLNWVTNTAANVVDPQIQ